MNKTVSKLTIVLISIIVSPLNAQNTEWKKSIREHITIDNITYFFPSEIDSIRRNTAIKECQNSVIENLKLIKETEFKNEFDIEFVNSKKEMLKFTGMAAQGMAFPDRNTFFTLLKDKNSPIKHEIMHMITMYKWGFPHDSSTWMNEGLATYAGGICSKNSFEEIYQYFIQSGKLIPMKSIVDDFYAGNDMITYTQSAYLVNYLTDKYGFEKFIQLWKQGFSSFKSIYGIEFEEIQNKIKMELKTKYPKAIEFDWEVFKKGCQ